MAVINNVCVIGLGVVGSATFKALRQFTGRDVHVYGVDLNRGKIDSLVESEEIGRSCFGINANDKHLPKMDLYSICVYDQEDVQVVLRNLHQDGLVPPAAVIIESTVDLEIGRWIKTYCDELKINAIVMPHRLNPGDEYHQVFNLMRVAAANSGFAWDILSDFYVPLFKRCGGGLHEKEDWDVAVCSKLVDNCYRYVQIAFVEEMRMRCEAAGVDFEQLRRASNTKWNINLLEARDGIGGTCLPKDIRLLMDSLPGFRILEAVYNANASYKAWCQVTQLAENER